MSNEHDDFTDLAEKARAHSFAGHAAFAAAIVMDPPYNATRAIPEWANGVESIEAQGWKLEHCTVGTDSTRVVKIYLLFRRSV